MKFFFSESELVVLESETNVSDSETTVLASETALSEYKIVVFESQTAVSDDESVTCLFWSSTSRAVLNYRVSFLRLSCGQNLPEDAATLVSSICVV